MKNTNHHTGTTISASLSSESGSAIVITLMVLVLLTIFGMASLSTTDSDLQVVTNERVYLQEFFTADSAWKDGARWLDDQPTPPPEVNSGADDIVKNFGKVGEDPASTDLIDIISLTDQEDGTMNGMPYWYSITYATDTMVAGSGPEYREFHYDSTANADGSQQIEVELSKIYKTGY